MWTTVQWKGTPYSDVVHHEETCWSQERRPDAESRHQLQVDAGAVSRSNEKEALFRNSRGWQRRTCTNNCGVNIVECLAPGPKSRNDLSVVCCYNSKTAAAGPKILCRDIMWRVGPFQQCRICVKTKTGLKQSRESLSLQVSRQLLVCVCVIMKCCTELSLHHRLFVLNDTNAFSHCFLLLSQSLTSSPHHDSTAGSAAANQQAPGEWWRSTSYLVALNWRGW